MKKIFIAAMLLIGVCYSTNAQSYVLEGNTFKSATVKAAKSDTIVTGYFFQDSKGKYPIIMNKVTTRCWVRKPHCKNKTYMKEDLEKAICENLGITYIPKKKKTSNNH